MLKLSYLLILFGVFVVVVWPVHGTVDAYHDERSTLFLYFSWMQQDGSWHEWVNATDTPVTNVSLSINQPVKCKLVGSSAVISCFSFRLHEPCPPSAYSFEVLLGNPYNKSFQFYIREPGFDLRLVEEQFHGAFRTTDELFEYVWVLRTNDRWTGAFSPLNCYYMIAYTVDDRVDAEQTIAYPYIRDELWTGPEFNSEIIIPDRGGIDEGSRTLTKNTQGIALLLMSTGITLIFISYLILKKRR